MKFENIYNGTNENIRLALLSLWTAGNHPMRSAIEEVLNREPLLAKPIFQSTFSWETTSDDTWKNFLNETVIRRLHIGETYQPYKHQTESWHALHENRSIVVTSGTGSGKTECFMYPIISDLYEQSQQGHQHAIEAIFLYPLNALMNDQKKRLSTYCRDIGLHFAVYNGSTPEFNEREALPNEVITRQQIRDAKTTPEILLTNPSMLEYMLVRKQDQDMIDRGNLRWIVIDEAHTYSGSAAVELAFQIKRILNAFGKTASDVRFACTSATIGGDSENEGSLREFISTITGQSVENIQVIGGSRLLPELDEGVLSNNLVQNNLPDVNRVLSLRKEINRVSAMSLQQIWEWLRPETPFDSVNVSDALHLIDQLCEMRQEGVNVLSLRAHYFMRTITGLYACANSHCEGANNSIPIYGHLTTYRAAKCKCCGEPLVELVQCKKCREFILMGNCNAEHIITQCEEQYYSDNFFTLDTDEDSEELDVNTDNTSSDTFYIIPNANDNYNPKHNAEIVGFNIEHSESQAKLTHNELCTSKWVELQSPNDDRKYCPSCGRLANRLNFKHFRIPVNFINQTISPILLAECAQVGYTWGKYIAFTDSRQGTAISAKLFNINSERIRTRQKLLDNLARNAPQGNAINFDGIPEQYAMLVLRQLNNNQEEGMSLSDVSNCLYDERLFEHLRDNQDNNVQFYKDALLRSYIGRKNLYDISAESLGLIKLVYPSLNGINMPNSLTRYCVEFNVNITDQDWRDYLKIVLDYYFRVGNHIQPLSTDVGKYVRQGGASTPVMGPDVNDDDNNNNCIGKWPKLRLRDDGTASEKQHRIITILCAGLGVTDAAMLSERSNLVSAILNDAWNALVNNDILTQVYDNTAGYEHYIGSYYLDLSSNSRTCRLVLARDAQLCPVTNKFLDTTFCNYSPMMTGELSHGLFEKYRCTGERINLPIRPANNNEINEWLTNNENVIHLKELGLWSDIHNYVYKDQRTYLAAEHSAQQSRELLDRYTHEFVQNPPEINVLHCSTTMEMGVDIGDIDVVLMDTIPPTAANYLQRVGRAGRNGQSKSVAFSICNDTPVGQYAFANPMWALQSANHMIQVRPSQTIIQRHVNSYFFRSFIKGFDGIQARMSIGEFVGDGACKQFVNFLNERSTNDEEIRRFHALFGNDIPYTIDVTVDMITQIQQEFNRIIDDLRNAYETFNDDDRRQLAISHQIRKIKEQNMLLYLSEHQFIPNANMPIGIVSFSYMDQDQSNKLRRLYRELDELRQNLNNVNVEQRDIIAQDIRDKQREINAIKTNTNANRDIRTALNEYAPGQTVVLNEKNYVSAGLLQYGAYNEETQTHAIYYCRNCGNIEYNGNLDETRHCPICGNAYHGVLDRHNGAYTLAYEPAGFRTDLSKGGTREEIAEKKYYDIKPILLNTNWNNHTDVNMCELISSGESDSILFYNAGIGHGFAFCKKCFRATIEDSIGGQSPNALATEDRSHGIHKHKRLWSNTNCNALRGDIARNIVLIGNHPTCYTVLRFKESVDAVDYVNDEQLVYSLGVIIKRALAICEGIDESEIDFGVKKERSGLNQYYALFIFDTAKGGCGYSLKLNDPVSCQKVLEKARTMLEEAPCNCHHEGGACTSCLIDRNNFRFQTKLSKEKALDWLTRQNSGILEVPEAIRANSPDATIANQTLKNILKKAVNDSDVRSITLCVSDENDDSVINDWISIRSEMGKYINTAVSRGKKVHIAVEFHPELHTSLSSKLPYINLNDKFGDCDVKMIKDMGPIKSAIIVESDVSYRRYFTDDCSILSFSNDWGRDSNRVFTDALRVNFDVQDSPSYQESPSMIVREGKTNATIFHISEYFKSAIAPAALNKADCDVLANLLRGQEVNIYFSDMYVNSALASLMLVYLIDELKKLFGFTIGGVILQLDSPKRTCNNDNFSEYTPISKNFSNKKEADKYTEGLFKKVLGIEPDYSVYDADHHRWLRIETSKDEYVEIRFDHGICGGYRSSSTYLNLDTLNGSVCVTRNNEDVLYYIIINSAK